VAGRHFTPEEANELLGAVRPLAERMVAHQERLAEAEGRRAELGRAAAGNGNPDPRALAAEQQRVEEEAAGVARCAEAIHELGAVVKDVGRGLVDFPALRDGEEVCLCWCLGEDAIEYWHGVDEGFAGRKPLPL
jgi:hypothetical protein